MNALSEYNCLKEHGAQKLDARSLRILLQNTTAELKWLDSIGLHGEPEFKDDEMKLKWVVAETTKELTRRGLCV